MFNTYAPHAVNHTTAINSVAGAIVKTHHKSWFERLNLEESRAATLLAEGGHEAYIKHNRGTHTEYERTPEKDIIILQMVVCGDMKVLAELVYAEDYECYENELSYRLNGEKGKSYE